MFTTCIHCNSDLGRNDAFETFPVGTRLAFDAANGRLWVVCRKCARWNLSPLDERWETIEAAERRFRDSRLRVSTDNVGLARLREGVDLIRIGEPQRPEMAAWRYGDQFGTRRKRQLMITGVALSGAALFFGGIAWVGVGVGGFVGGGGNLLNAVINGRQNESIGRIALPDGRLVNVKRKHARMSALERSADAGRLSLRLESEDGTHLLEGDDAMRVAARLMPTVNRFGGSARQVQDAVALLEEAGDPIRVLRSVQQRVGATPLSERWTRRTGFFANDGGQVTKIPGALHALAPRDRLAIEMALHEESERRAMDGELAQLEAAWRDAEEIAKIADNLFVLPSVEAQFEQLRLGVRDGASPDASPRRGPE